MDTKIHSFFQDIKCNKDLYKYREANKTLFFWKKQRAKTKVRYNFGDFLSLIIVGEIIKKNNLKAYNNLNKKLFAVGSILHFSKTGDIIWGSGVNGKISADSHNFTNLDVRMVRGKLTQEFLKNKGIQVNPVFGDPALLLPFLFPNMKPSPISGKVIAIPNLNEFDICQKLAPNNITVISPFTHWSDVITEILSSEIVLSSSLHGLIIAEAFSVPVRLYKPSKSETLFKYQDYLSGTGRENEMDISPPSFIESFSKGEGLTFSPASYDINKMLDAFPIDIFKPNER